MKDSIRYTINTYNNYNVDEFENEDHLHELLTAIKEVYKDTCNDVISEKCTSERFTNELYGKWCRLLEREYRSADVDELALYRGGVEYHEMQKKSTNWTPLNLKFHKRKGNGIVDINARVVGDEFFNENYNETCDLLKSFYQSLKQQDATVYGIFIILHSRNIDQDYAKKYIDTVLQEYRCSNRQKKINEKTFLILLSNDSVICYTVDGKVHDI